MDLLPFRLVPAPEQVVAAAGNLAHKVLQGEIADLRPMPRTLLDEGILREVYRYHPAEGVATTGDPVLLVAPLAAPATCYDLRRGCSLVEHLVGSGRPTYVVEYGAVSFSDRDLGIDPWVDDVLPTAIRQVSANCGGRPVHLIGWSLGGTFSMLAVADRPDLPVASLTTLGSPVDVTRVPLVAPLRPMLDWADRRDLATRAYQLFGSRSPLLRWTVEQSAFQRLVTKPVAVLTHLDDAEFLAQIEAVDRFTGKMTAYRGRAFGQVYHRFAKGNQLATGEVDVGGRTVRLADVAVPVLVVGGSNDRIAPIPAVTAAVPLLTGSGEVWTEIVPGGHLGLLTGRTARSGTWPVVDEWLDRWAGADPIPRNPAQPAGSAGSAGSAATIGTSRERRHRSSVSRALQPGRPATDQPRT